MLINFQKECKNRAAGTEPWYSCWRKSLVNVLLISMFLQIQQITSTDFSHCIELGLYTHFCLFYNLLLFVWLFAYILDIILLLLLSCAFKLCFYVYELFYAFVCWHFSLILYFLETTALYIWHTLYMTHFYFWISNIFSFIFEVNCWYCMDICLCVMCYLMEHERWAPMEYV